MDQLRELTPLDCVAESHRQEALTRRAFREAGLPQDPHTVLPIKRGSEIRYLELTLTPRYTESGAFAGIRGLARDVTAERAERQQLAKEGTTDPLTGLANRRTFDAVFKQAFERSSLYGDDLSLLMVDLDYFKRLNDTHGHRAGDAVLEGTGNTLPRVVRPTDTVARYGGEEFVVIMPLTSLEAAATAGERVRRSIRDEEYRYGGKRLSVTASVGAAWTDGRAFATADGFLEAADRAVYQAKRLGRDRVCLAGHGESALAA
jgi:diguanylate cyclase (GGDEF)-like protein